MRLFIATDLVLEGGKMRPIIREKIAAVLKEREGKQITIEIREPRQYPKEEEQRFYFAKYINPIREYFLSHGQMFDSQALHEMIMVEIGGFMDEVESPITGKIRKKRRSFNSLSQEERRDYYIRIEVWCAENGIVIKDER